MPKEKSCGAIVFKKSKDEVKYLLLRYSAGHWDFPKGKQEQDETEHQTAERELKEEAGITGIRFVEDFKDMIHYFYKKGGETIYKEVVFFLAETDAESVKLSFEHTDYEWLTCESALKKLTFSNARELLRKADQFMDKTNV